MKSLKLYRIDELNNIPRELKLFKLSAEIPTLYDSIACPKTEIILIGILARNIEDIEDAISNNAPFIYDPALVPLQEVPSGRVVRTLNTVNRLYVIMED